MPHKLYNRLYSYNGDTKKWDVTGEIELPNKDDDNYGRVYVKDEDGIPCFSGYYDKKDPCNLNRTDHTQGADYDPVNAV